MATDYEIVCELKNHPQTKQTLAILEANPRTESTALKIRELLLQQEKTNFVFGNTTSVYSQILYEDGLMTAVSIMAVAIQYGDVVGSEILVLPPYRKHGLGKQLLSDKIKWYNQLYPDGNFTTKVACDNMASINMCLSTGSLQVSRCIEVTRENGEKFNQLLFTLKELD